MKNWCCQNKGKTFNYLGWTCKILKKKIKFGYSFKVRHITTKESTYRMKWECCKIYIRIDQLLNSWKKTKKNAKLQNKNKNKSEVCSYHFLITWTLKQEEENSNFYFKASIILLISWHTLTNQFWKINELINVKW